VSDESHSDVVLLCGEQGTSCGQSIARLLFRVTLGIVGLAKKSDDIIGIAFDILSLEALFLVPRYVNFHAAQIELELTSFVEYFPCSV
jgi:hypothetical protein